MPIRYAILPLLAITVSLGACCKKKLYCQTGDMKIAIVGYTRSESRNMIVKRYKSWEHDKALDSGTFIYSGNVPLVVNKPDTLWFSDYKAYNNYNIKSITGGNDWAIELPSVRERYLITAMYDDNHRSEMVKCGDNSTTCTAAITQFVVNESWTEGNVLWIRKVLR